MKELAQIDKAAIDRPVSDLARELPSIIDVITHKNGSEGEPHIAMAGSTHADRVQEALGNMYMDITCSNCGMVRTPGTRNLPTIKDGVPRKPNALA